MRHTLAGAALATLLAWPVTADTSKPVYDVLVGPRTVACDTLEDVRVLWMEQKVGRCAFIGATILAEVQLVDVVELPSGPVRKLWIVQMKNKSGDVVFSFLSADPATIWTARVEGVAL